MLRGFYDYIWNIVIWGKIKIIISIDTCQSSADCVAQDSSHTHPAHIIDTSHDYGSQLRPGDIGNTLGLYFLCYEAFINRNESLR